MAAIGTIITVVILVVHERAVAREWNIPKWLRGNNNGKKLAEVNENNQMVTETVKANRNVEVGLSQCHQPRFTVSKAVQCFEISFFITLEVKGYEAIQSRHLMLSFT